MGGHYDVGGVGVVKTAKGGVVQKTVEQIIQTLMRLDDKALQMVVDGLDPEGGSVPADIVVLAKAEQKRRQSAPAGPGGTPSMPSVGGGAGKGGVAKYVIGGGLVLGLGWLVLKAARGSGRDRERDE